MVGAGRAEQGEDDAKVSTALCVFTVNWASSRWSRHMATYPACPPPLTHTICFLGPTLLTRTCVRTFCRPPNTSPSPHFFPHARAPTNQPTYLPSAPRLSRHLPSTQQPEGCSCALARRRRLGQSLVCHCCLLTISDPLLPAHCMTC